LKEFSDLFAWKYEDLNTYDTRIIDQKIPFKDNKKHFRKKLKQSNPMLLTIMEREVKKSLDAQIIISLRYSNWIGNLVPVKK
jgi:hypothetical protein